MDDDPPFPPPHFGLLAAVFEGFLALVAVGLGRLLGQQPLETLSFDVSAVGMGAAATVPPLLVLAFCLWCPVRPLVGLRRVVDEVLVPLFKDCGLLELLVISLLAGIGEEMLFRGVIQAVVADWVGGDYGVWVGLAAASVIFGLAHPITAAYVLLAAAIGAYLGLLWIATGNLLVPIVVHATYDFLALVILVRLRAGR